MSIALDTNVIVRYIRGDDPQQFQLAEELIDRRCSAAAPAVLSLVVLVELWWVLTVRYRLSRSAAADVFAAIFDNDHLDVIDRDTAETALSGVVAGTGDFADLVIASLARRSGARTTFTFDRKAARHPDLTLLTHESLDALG